MADADTGLGATRASRLLPRGSYGGLAAVHGALFAVQLGYGGAVILSKVALTNGVNSFVFAVYRDLVALAVLVPSAYFAEREERTPLTFPILALMWASGLTGVYGGQVLTLIGLSLTSASMAACIPISIPVFTYIISVSLGLEKIHWQTTDGQAKLFSILFAVSGAVVLLTVKGAIILGATVPTGFTEPILSGKLAAALLYSNIESWQLGAICLLLGGLCYAIFIVLQVPALSRYPAPISLTSFSYFFGAIILALSGFLTIKDSSSWIINQRSTVIPFVYTGLVSSALNFTIQAWACQTAGPLVVAFYVPLQSFTGAILAHLLLGEPIFLGSVAGALLIATALYLITWSRIKTKQRDSLLGGGMLLERLQ